ncbi:MAG: helicase-related protein [Candidatus Paceibacterota bacterium]|jgi:excinuclease ABC subunit B
MQERKFKIKAEYSPDGDQPEAIKELVAGLEKGLKKQTLFGVTGSGKTFTVANVIEKIQKPTLVIAHNKTLAAQLAQEYKEFFPENAVHYFVSYYDYYQPEAYMPVTDTYIEKEAMINEEIDRLRHASTQALLTRKDVIIVASVSCIYGLGSPAEYEKVNIKMKVGEKLSRHDVISKLINVHFERTNSDIKPGTFRAIGNSIEVMPVNEKILIRLDFDEDRIKKISRIDSVSRKLVEDEIQSTFIFPAKHFITDKEQQERAFKSIKAELEVQLEELKKAGKNLEAERLRRRTTYDLSLIREVGYCNGIENYSRHFSGKAPGEAPDSLLEYFPKKEDGTPDFLTIIDESHVTISQIRGMYAGDASRKKTLIDYGFRLPSAKDNRPLKFDEFEKRVNQIVYTTATPGDYEKENSQKVVEQVIRPTGLIDPVVEVKPITEVKGKNLSQVFDFIQETEKVVKNLPAPRPGIFYVYAILCNDGSIYIGQTNDLQKRWEEHKSGTGAEHTKKFGVQKIIHYEEFSSREDAVKREHDLKTGFGRKWLQREWKAGRTRQAGGGRVIATTLTKKMAEDLSEYLKEKGVKAEYLHSEIKTIDRIDILTNFRKGKFDCLVGVNLLREGLDLPEVEFIGILDADKEGFLRSDTSLIQTIGRAARNVLGRVVLYADRITGSMERAIGETNRRREKQIVYNTKHGITPKTIIKKIHDITDNMRSDHDKAVKELVRIDEEMMKKSPMKLIKQKEIQMNAAVKMLDFETAAILRDEVKLLKEKVEKNEKEKIAKKSVKK